MELAQDVHDYLERQEPTTYLQADLKHAYYSIVLHPEDRHIYAFTVPGFSQLQPTRLLQGLRGTSSTMSTLMNRTLGTIPQPNPKPPLLAGTKDAPPPLKFYMDDILGGFAGAEKQYEFLARHFCLRIEWARLRLSFIKLRLFVQRVVTLGAEHQAGGAVKVTNDRVMRLAKWPLTNDVREVRSFMGA